MTEALTKEIVRQIPTVKAFVDTINKDNWSSIATVAVNQLGEKVVLSNFGFANEEKFNEMVNAG